MAKEFTTKIYNVLLSDSSRKKVDDAILVLALVSFIVHLAIIYLGRFGVLELPADSDLFSNPISAIYTPFSFILIYEVYLLIFYLPRSFTTYITKQYEIITFIIIRRLFKDLASLELSSDWFAIKEDLQFTYDLLASLILFYLIYLFKKHGRRTQSKTEEVPPNIQRFVRQKKTIAVILVPLFVLMGIYTLVNWAVGISSGEELLSFDAINNLFFDQFFTVLILVDVILLLFSFFYTDRFHKIIRNSGFVISTILIRISFGVSGSVNTLLIITAVLFGLLIVLIHNQYAKIDAETGIGE